MLAQASWLLLVLLSTPIVSIGIMSLVKSGHVKWIRSLGITLSFIPFGLANYLFFLAQERTLELSVSWVSFSMSSWLDLANPSYRIESYFHLELNRISSLFLLISTLCIFIAAIVGAQLKKRWKHFYIFIFLSSFGVTGSLLSVDLFLYLLFYHIAIISIYFLLSIWGKINREVAGKRFLAYQMAGLGLLFVGFILLVSTFGVQVVQGEGGEIVYTFSSDSVNILSQLNAKNVAEHIRFIPEYMRNFIFITLLLSFMLLIPIIPFHRWMIMGVREGSAPAIILSTAVILQTSFYGFYRFLLLMFPEIFLKYVDYLHWIGIFQFITGSLIALRQIELRSVFAYYVLSQIGLITVGVSLGTQMGWQSSFLLVVSLGLITSLFSILLQNIYQRYGSTSILQIKGFSKHFPFFGSIWIICCMIALNFPGSINFFGMFLLVASLFQTAQTSLIPIALGMLGLFLVFVKKMMVQAYDASKAGTPYIQKDARFIEALPLIFLLSWIILFGIYPSIWMLFLQQVKLGG